ncbi:MULTISPECIES: thioesterase family protein [Actinosynnema]|uniref:Aromatic compound degradation protein PaaI n=1 Tax=Actinosynnema pretiosum TaxID=42197 RepID=A0A290ZEX8_9PSEU|nr:thioesterase family protein [Actinosynnema pretiosum]ATE57578.1 aromatic compound degradation protein PaaI [Actinosynnema pretiosum]
MPFSQASAVRPLGDGTYTAALPAEWTTGQSPHGGFLLAVLARAAAHAATAPNTQPAPLAVSAQFLRAAEVGPVLIRTSVRRAGRAAAVVTCALEQRGQTCVEAAVTVGAPPTSVEYADLPDLAASPPQDAVDVSALAPEGGLRLAGACELRLDPVSAGFLRGRAAGPLLLRLWARPLGEQPDPYFALVTGDVPVPVTVNLGRRGWSPAVQLTALVRSAPAAGGWLRLQVTCRAVHGQWYDEDVVVVDAAGKLVLQSRKLALTPPPA